MTKRILIVGAGFAATDAALSAARLRDLQKVSSRDLAITVIAPNPVLTVRPRLYEPNPEKMVVPLLDLFSAVDVNFVQGTVNAIDTEDQTVTFENLGNDKPKLTYDRLILAAGSSLFRPPIPGVDEHTFSVDNVSDAVSLDGHLNSLVKRPASAKRNTIVVAGGGFTGIEVATEMPTRLRKILGRDDDVQVVLVERSSTIAPDMGDEARPHIIKALNQLGIRAVTGAGITSVDADGVTLSNGERIDASTVIWSAGMRATDLTALINAERDNLGRLLVDANLAVPGVANVYATGDAAKAASDDLGNYTLMSCQHAKRMGAFAGNNAAASLMNVEPEPYHQRTYVTCLDLGEPGALFTRGWDRKVEATGADAKTIKQEVNTIWIYPPKADRNVALAYAKPSSVVDF
ncbi:NAD(P)/FAD-dependent oxidoreductase [Candidatus Nitrotoga sp. M5]|uniref:NAD(P)/FAD-dependent oxidoreductase n=1 Tax=Candidatus Nitrotoga sp. M5 TaxID=2890409 RepID=UPI001EF3DA2D|nr:FAD-dependent oxidoreductase [Candidatus Nitrotoga sp. M5]CAH1387487.1 NADH dehydrogenase [Candidatus Nitrotoga sp. M5]